MKTLISHCICLAVLWLYPAVTQGASTPISPVRLIFDTDMGNDVDDALALAMIHALQSRGECQLLAVMLSKQNSYAATYVDMVNHFYHRGNIPVARVQNGKTPDPGKFLPGVVEARDAAGKPLYPHKLGPDSPALETVTLYRTILATQPDASVVMVVVGFSTNPARLLESKPDEHSLLSGRELVMRKVKFVSMMAGSFVSDGPRAAGEYNITKDLPSAQKFFSEWPTPVIVSPWELGSVIKYPASSIDLDYSYVPHHPVAHAYRLWQKFPYDRATYDLTSVLYAVRPDRGYFTLSAPGIVRVDSSARTSFSPNPTGPHRILEATPTQRSKTLEAMIYLCSQPPGKL